MQDCEWEHNPNDLCPGNDGAKGEQREAGS